MTKGFAMPKVFDGHPRPQGPPGAAPNKVWPSGDTERA